MAERKEARTAAHRGALADLRAWKHVLFGGHTRGGEGLWLLTLLGLDAAMEPLGRTKNEMGGTARRSHPGRARDGGQRDDPDPAAPEAGPVAADERAPEAVVAATTSGGSLPGLGSLGSYFTEVQLPYTGTWSTPGKRGVQADIVVAAPGRRVPPLFVEVGNCFENAAVLAEKFDKYARVFARRITNTDGQDKLMWRQKRSAPEARWGDAPHPPGGCPRLVPGAGRLGCNSAGWSVACSQVPVEELREGGLGHLTAPGRCCLAPVDQYE